LESKTCEYEKIIKDCSENITCLRKLVNKSYISNYSEITSLEKVYEILLLYHREHHNIFLKLQRSQSGIPEMWKHLFTTFLISNHKSLFESDPPDYSVQIDFSKHILKKDISKILDTYEFGIRNNIHKFFPSDIQYLVLCDTTHTLYDFLKSNVIFINKVNEEITKNNCSNRLRHNKNIFESYVKIYSFLRKNPATNLNNPNILEEINRFTSSEQKEDEQLFDYDKIYEEHKTNDTETNYELLFHKAKLQNNIYDLIFKFLYINAYTLVHSLEEDTEITDTNNKTIVFGNSFLLKKYGFFDINYIYKLNSQVNFGLSHIISWSVEQNNITTLNFAKSERLISGIFIINNDLLPTMLEDFIDKPDNNIKNLRLLEIIQIHLPLMLDKKFTEGLMSRAEAETKRKYYIHIYYVFYDIQKKIIVILNNRGRIIYPGEILEIYTVTYRELTMLYTYNCNFYRCKIDGFKFLYLISPAEYSQRLPSILKKKNLYDEFKANFEPVFIIKDRENSQSFIIIKKNLDLVSYPTEYKELYKNLKEIGQIKIQNPSVTDYLPFHSQQCINDL
jgi:hypothetical protein